MHNAVKRTTLVLVMNLNLSLIRNKELDVCREFLLSVLYQLITASEFSGEQIDDNSVYSFSLVRCLIDEYKL